MLAQYPRAFCRFCSLFPRLFCSWVLFFVPVVIQKKVMENFSGDSFCCVNIAVIK